MPTYFPNWDKRGAIKKFQIASLSDLTVAEGMGKDAKWFAVTIATIPNITFQMSNAPCAVLDLASIGRLGISENKKVSKIVCDVVGPALEIEPDRVYICFFDLAEGDIGWNQTTFHGIME